MNDEMNEQPEESTEKQVPQSKIVTDELDVDAALAAVARLGEIAEAAERSKQIQVEEPEDDEVEDDEQLVEVEAEDDESLELESEVDEAVEQTAETIVETEEDYEGEFEQDTYYDEYDPEELTMQPVADSMPEVAPQPLEPEPNFSHVESTFSRPPLMRLQRGQAASVIPALLLIASGAWLTFALTTGAALPDPLILLSAGVGGLGVIFLSLWMSSQRWAQGGFFIGAWLLLSSIVLIYLFQPTGLDFNSGWALLIVAFGAAWALTGFITFPRRVPFGVVGLLIAIAGGLGTGVLSNQLDARLVDIAQSLLPVALIFLVIIIVLPMISRRRRAQ